MKIKIVIKNIKIKIFNAKFNHMLIYIIKQLVKIIKISLYIRIKKPEIKYL